MDSGALNFARVVCSPLASPKNQHNLFAFNLLCAVSIDFPAEVKCLNLTLAGEWAAKLAEQLEFEHRDCYETIWCAQRRAAGMESAAF